MYFFRICDVVVILENYCCFIGSPSDEIFFCGVWFNRNSMKWEKLNWILILSTDGHEFIISWNVKQISIITVINLDQWVKAAFLKAYTKPKYIFTN